MKKLMIAAAGVALIGSASAGLCDPETVADSCSLYNVKFTFKTLAAKKACAEGAKWLCTVQPVGSAWSIWYRSATADAAAAAAAAAAGRAKVAADYIGKNIDPDGAYGTVTRAAFREVYWMDNATRKFDGVLWQCSADCFEGFPGDLNAANNGRINFALWEKKASLAMSLPVFQVKFVDGADTTKVYGQEYASFDEQNNMWLGRYAKTAQKLAAYWTPRLRNGQSINAAGFGTYDVKNLRMKSVSGNAVGLIAPLNEQLIDACGNVGNFFCAIGFLCVEWSDWCCDGCYAGVELVPASGTWSIKYNASATKKANSDKATLATYVPSYMFYATASQWAIFRNVDPNLHTDGYYWINNDTGALLYKKEGEEEEAVATKDEAIDNVANLMEEVFDIRGRGVAVVDDDGKVTGYKYGAYTYNLTEDGVLDLDNPEIDDAD